MVLPLQLSGAPSGSVTNVYGFHQLIIHKVLKTLFTYIYHGPWAVAPRAVGQVRKVRFGAQWVRALPGFGSIKVWQGSFVRRREGCSLGRRGCRLGRSSADPVNILVAIYS